MVRTKASEKAQFHNRVSVVSASSFFAGCPQQMINWQVLKDNGDLDLYLHQSCLQHSSVDTVHHALADKRIYFKQLHRKLQTFIKRSLRSKQPSSPRDLYVCTRLFWQDTLPALPFMHMTFPVERPLLITV